MRIQHHPILGPEHVGREVTITVDGKAIKASEGEVIAAALAAGGIRILRHTTKQHKPRGLFCAIGQCTDCAMIVNGVPNVRTCVTPVADGMVIQTQGSGGREGT